MTPAKKTDAQKKEDMEFWVFFVYIFTLIL